jgi:bifunctional non-homologous end joining protein LigD
VLYPEAGFTKGHVIDYYTRVAPALLPHLRGRPLTLKRYPNGVDKPHFYEKQCPSHRPEWVRTAPIYSRSNRRTIDFCLCDDLPTLVWLANLADLEMHTSLALAEDDECPTVLAFDLDPGPPATIVECGEVALELRAIFAHLGMEAFPKTSGSKGMQVYVPLNTPATYPQTREFAHGLAQLLERRRPELVVSEMKKSVRGGKVFVDWSQNAQHKTTVCVYSLRALAQPTVSTPLTWDEVEAVTESRDPADLVFTSADVLARVAEHGDHFAPVLELEQALPEAL